MQAPVVARRSAVVTGFFIRQSLAKQQREELPVHADDSQGTLHPIHSGKRWRAKQESIRQIALSDSPLALADSNPFSHERVSVFISGLYSIFCHSVFDRGSSVQSLERVSN